MPEWSGHSIPPVEHILGHTLREHYLARRLVDRVGDAVPADKLRVAIVFRFGELGFFMASGRKITLLADDSHEEYRTGVFAQYKPFIDELLRRFPRHRLFVELYSDGAPMLAWLARQKLIRDKGRERSVTASVRDVIRTVRCFREQIHAFDRAVRPDGAWIGGTAEQMRRVIHATAVAPIVLATRRAGIASTGFWEPHFPDLGLRSPRLPQVVNVVTDSLDDFRRHLGADHHST